MEIGKEKKGPKAWIGFLVAAIVIGFVVGGYFLLKQGKPEKYTGPIEKIVVSGSRASILFFIAEEHGYFTDNGLDIHFELYNSGKQATDAMLKGKTDISTAADFVFVSNAFSHPDLRTFGTITMRNSIHLLARKDRGINAIRDLKGKRVGVTRKSVAEFFLGTFLIMDGFFLDDIEIIDLNPISLIEAIDTGKIDAGITWNPHAHNIRKRLGNIAISWPAQRDQPYYFLLITRNKWLQENPEPAKRLIASLVQAEEYIKANNESAKNLIMKKFNFEPSYMDVAWGDDRFKVILSQTLLITMEDQARWRIKNKLTDKAEVPNYLDHIYMDALEKVKPDAITIAR